MGLHTVSQHFVFRIFVISQNLVTYLHSLHVLSSCVLQTLLATTERSLERGLLCRKSVAKATRRPWQRVRTAAGTIRRVLADRTQASSASVGRNYFMNNSLRHVTDDVM